ncbi:terminase large subunit [Ammonicoccus fulvus]|uniref:Terminase large subunit n=1 Tax=Ammonicoccus fulvus TaxID=3138240 RepID=A0ABZ3FSA2_9ACTN
MKPGAKTPITVDPLDLSGWPRDRARRRLRFIRQYVLTPKGVGAGKPFKIHAFQKEIIVGAFAPGIRTSLVSLPRANGKTALAAALAVAELFCGPEAAEVLVVASDERQARIALNMAIRMITINPELKKRAWIYKDKIVIPHTGSQMLALPADPSALHGWDPSLLVVDELHVVSEAVWEAVSSVSGKRPESLTLAISTPSTTPDSIMFKLVEHGRSGEDRSFYLKEYAAPPGCDLDDREAWAEANPAMNLFLAADGLAAARRTLREPVFRQLRLGQWVTAADGWLPFGAWAEVADTSRIVSPGTRITLGFDGSASGDSTALIAATVEPNPHIFPIAIWENPGDERWRVPRGDVDRAVDLAFDQYDVAELACDPWGWRSEIEAWAARHGEKHVVEYNTGARQRMAPATDRFYQSVVEHHLTHNNDPRLAAHIAHAVAKRTPTGDLIEKQHRMSPHKIDAAVAAIVALDRAHWHINNPKRRRVASFR